MRSMTLAVLSESILDGEILFARLSKSSLSSEVIEVRAQPTKNNVTAWDSVIHVKLANGTRWTGHPLSTVQVF